MNFELTRTQQEVVAQTQKFVQAHLAPHAGQSDRDSEFNTAAVKHMGPAGFLMATVPKDQGGEGWGAVAYVHSIKLFSKACAACTVGMSVTNMVAEAIARMGTEVQRKKYFRLIKAGNLAAFALTESHSGSDAAALKTTAKPTAKGYVLSGNKIFVSSGAKAAFVLVFARTRAALSGKSGDGISAFLIDRGTPGLSVGKEENKMGLRGSNTVELIFNQCEVSQVALLGEEGNIFSQALTSLSGGRISVGATACGLAEAALEASITYAEVRKQFGVPLSHMQAVQGLLADMRVELDAAWMLTLQAAYLKEQGENFVKAASMCKVYASEAANRICRKAIQIHGGVGYTRQYPVERYFRDCKVTTLFEGTSEIQRHVISREILK